MTGKTLIQKRCAVCSQVRRREGKICCGCLQLMDTDTEDQYVDNHEEWLKRFKPDLYLVWMDNGRTYTGLKPAFINYKQTWIKEVVG